jgi:hypothetical protein
MRLPLLGIGAAVALAAAAFALHGRFHFDPLMRAHAAPLGPMMTTPIAADTIGTTEPGFGVMVFRVPLPDGAAGADGLELRFREPLDGARVDAFASGPRLHQMLLRKRIGGDSVVVPMPPGTVDTIEVRVHRNLRPPPIVRDVALLTPATPAAATADPPPATSPRSTR